MAKLYEHFKIFTVLCFHIAYCISDFSSEKLLEKTQTFRNIQNNFERNFITEAETVELPDISLKSSDQIMSAEYMFNFLNKLETEGSVRKASGASDNDGDLDDADTVRSFSSKGKMQRRMTDVYKFKVHSLSVDEKIKRVEMRMRYNEQMQSHRVKVKYVIRQNNKNVLKFSAQELLEKDGKYFVLNLTEEIKPVLNQLHGNVTIKVAIKQRKKQKPSGYQKSGDEDALLLLFSEDKGFMQKMYQNFSNKSTSEQLSRTKRAIVQRKKKKGKRKRKICQLEDFEIDFNHLGWGQWVVFPKVFNAKICTGACHSPIANNFTPTNHAMLQSLMRLGQPKVAPMPCCVPTRLRPLKLLYYEKDEIVVRHHENMIASSCGCR